MHKADSKRLREMLNFFEPGYTVPSYATLWATVTHHYDTLRENIEKEMKGRSVSLTTWTSSTMEPYMISRILVHLGDGQPEMGYTLISSDS